MNCTPGVLYMEYCNLHLTGIMSNEFSFFIIAASVNLYLLKDDHNSHANVLAKYTLRGVSKQYCKIIKLPYTT